MTATSVQALREERAKLIAEADALKAAAAAEGRGLNGEENTKFNALLDDEEKFREQIKAAEKEAALASVREKRLEAAKADLERAQGTVFGRQAAGSDGAFAHKPPMFRGKAMRLKDAIVARRASPEYCSAFGDYLNGGAFPGAVLQSDLVDQGGYLAPPQFVAELVKTLDDMFWMRRLARVLPPTTKSAMIMPRRTARASAYTWGAELSTPTADTAMRFGTYKLQPHYMTGEHELSNDLANGSEFNVESLLMDEIAFQAGDLEEKAFFTGTGNDQPLGIFTPNATGLPTSRDTTGAATAFETYVKAKMSIRDVYRNTGLTWVENRKALETQMGIKDSTGQPIFLPSIRDGEPDRLIGTPVRLSEYAPTGTGASNAYQAGDYVAVIGNFQFYDILDGLDFGVTRHTDSAYNRKNCTGYIVRRKVDGCVRIPEAFSRVIVG